jgi:hypothetical protein
MNVASRQARGGGPRGLAIEWSATRGGLCLSRACEISTISKCARWISAGGDPVTAWLAPAKQNMQCVNAGAKMHRLAGAKIHQRFGKKAPELGAFSSGIKPAWD